MSEMITRPRRSQSRVTDEILVDVMTSASGIEYADAHQGILVREVGGVPIPFASPRLLWQ